MRASPIEPGLLAAAVAALTIACGDARPPRGRPGDAAPARVVDAAPLGPELVLIERTAIEEAFWPLEAGARPERETLEHRAHDRLVLSGLFAIDPPVEPARIRRARAHAAYAVELLPADKRKARVRATARVRIEWRGVTDDLAIDEVAVCDRDRPSAAEVPEVARAMLGCALDTAFGGVVTKERVRRGDERAIVAALDGDEPSLRSAAFAAIGEHRLTRMVPRLLELLGSQDELVRDGAIGALVALREPRAVDPLTRLAKFGDLDMMRRIIDAVGAIGGDDARAYLELVAGGHEVPAVREMARRALERLERVERRGP